MQGSRAEQDAGGDSYEHKSSAAVEKDVKTPKNTGQTSPQGRRLKAPGNVVLDKSDDGDTPELLRILSGRHGPGLVQCQQVDVCQANHVGLTALHHAVLANNLDAAKLLLCHGADANAQDVHGFSPLHTAAACGSLPITTLLVLFGADVFALTHENEMPVDVAKDLGIVRVLSTEMTRLIHRELWLTAVVRARADDAWLLLRKVLAYVLLFFLHLVSLIRKNVVSQRDHKKI
nr:hypothetical protein BaRGS_023920 [Batillaria attramentaria]